MHIVYFTFLGKCQNDSVIQFEMGDAPEPEIPPRPCSAPVNGKAADNHAADSIQKILAVQQKIEFELLSMKNQQAEIEKKLDQLLEK